MKKEKGQQFTVQFILLNSYFLLENFHAQSETGGRVKSTRILLSETILIETFIQQYLNEFSEGRIMLVHEA
ncbi:CLUMA_CG007282, isoform A [Clunio marinus]|uniref:CLUMA_CG007282, isoform A n=1 Tax=Clunio marinus TaxID=568069 RepID=A0A1J1I1X0_9DIPT|nr:CLUMA_CG007282, isoform A [Clunio marinus]